MKSLSGNKDVKKRGWLSPKAATTLLTVRGFNDKIISQNDIDISFSATWTPSTFDLNGAFSGVHVVL